MEEMDVRMDGDDCWIFALLVESGTWVVIAWIVHAVTCVMKKRKNKVADS